MFKDTHMEEEVKMHYPIKLSFSKSMRLFCINRMNCCFKKSSLGKPSLNTRLYKLYEEGMERLDHDLCIENMIKNIRDMKVLIK